MITQILRDKIREFHNRIDPEADEGLSNLVRKPTHTTSCVSMYHDSKGQRLPLPRVKDAVNP
jgi:hypothetical protein